MRIVGATTPPERHPGTAAFLTRRDPTRSMPREPHLNCTPPEPVKELAPDLLDWLFAIRQASAGAKRHDYWVWLCVAVAAPYSRGLGGRKRLSKSQGEWSFVVSGCPVLAPAPSLEEELPFSPWPSRCLSPSPGDDSVPGR
jgi:hypothetical protein